MNFSLDVSPAARRAARGFTLIELMIAMVLGLIVIAGVSSIFLANQQTYRSNEALSEVQDGARVAFEMLARDIRVAGLSGCNTTNGRVSNVLSPPASGSTCGGSNWFADWDKALIGYDNLTSIDDPALQGLTGTGAPVVGNSSVHILSTGSANLTISSIPSQTSADFKVIGDLQNLQSGDVIMACNYDHAALLQITNYNASNGTFGNVTHNTGNSTCPGNCSKNLGYSGLSYPANCNLKENNFSALDLPAKVAKLSGHVWYIGTNSTGGKSLYVLNAVNNGTTGISVTPQEMVRNVTKMTIKYLQPPSATIFDIAANMTNWATVNSAQVTLTLASTFQKAGTDSQPLTRKFTTTATVRNRVN